VTAPSLSVIVCTHNPVADYLRRVLAALDAQTLHKAEWELVLIDNASATPLAGAWDLSWHPRARLVREAELGLTPARQRGIRETSAAVLVYVDDDNVLAPDYLRTAQALLRSHPHLGAIGAGVLEPDFAVTPSRELVPYLPALALRNDTRASWSGNTADRASVPWGAGLCVTRPVADAYGALLEHLDVRDMLDRRGERLFGNGDMAFSWSAARLGLGFGVFPALRATHLIRAERLTQRYLLRLAYDLNFSNGVSDYLWSGTMPGGQRSRAEELLRLALRTLRRGPFAMRMGWAGLRGTDAASKFIASRGLQPRGLHLQPSGQP
jgi:glycosyltransferase involved in cell wall biosynthesis